MMMNKDRFSRIDNTAPAQDPLQNKRPTVQRSAFNFSCMRAFNGQIGMLMPFDLIETLPGEDYKISYDILAMTRNPTVRRLLSGMRIYVHTWYGKCSDQWEGFNTAVTKGRSGDITLPLPFLHTQVATGDGTPINKTTLTPMSPADYFGVPIVRYNNENPIKSFRPTNMTTSTTVKACNAVPTAKINALPFALYQRIYRDKYMSKNLVQDNKNILPDNEEQYILPYDATECIFLSHEFWTHTMPVESILEDVDSDYYVPNGQKQGDFYFPLALNAIRFRQFKGDYFNSALPFQDLVRGTLPSIDVSSITGTIDWTNTVAVIGDTDPNLQVSTSTNRIGSNSLPAYNALKAALDNATVSGTASAVLNMNQFRQLQAYTIFMERNARTDGDYNTMIDAQFGSNPHCHDRSPQYIGGTYQDIVFSEILQTSESTEQSPLGTQAGRGVSASSGFVGKFHSPDFGYIISIMSIVPDTYYTQGLPRMLTRVNQSDFYFPILNNLAPQAILNQELYGTGVEATDKDVFGYTERYSEFKSRPNRVSGLLSLNHDVADYDASSIMARRFSSSPELNQTFVSMSPSNIDMKVFAVEDEPPFDIQVACRIDKVSPMPFVTVPDDSAL